MVCAKCERLQRSKTQLATPGVKRKSDLYYGSPASSSAPTKGKPSATLGQTGVSKNKLLGKGAQNPYAAYSSSCQTCHKKVEGGRSYCQGCAYKANACAVCGKTSTKKGTATALVEGQKRSAK